MRLHQYLLAVCALKHVHFILRETKMSISAAAEAFSSRFLPEIVALITSYMDGLLNTSNLMFLMKLPRAFEMHVTYYRRKPNGKIHYGRLINGLPHSLGRSPSCVKGYSFGIDRLELQWHSMGSPKPKFPRSLCFIGGNWALYEAIFPNGIRVYETVHGTSFTRIRAQNGRSIGTPCKQYDCTICDVCASEETVFINTCILRLQSLYNTDPDTLTIDSFV